MGLLDSVLRVFFEWHFGDRLVGASGCHGLVFEVVAPFFSLFAAAPQHIPS
jgi:hypothetical protein